MLLYDLSPNNLGMTLWGDFPTLVQLYKTIDEINEGSTLIEDKDGLLFALENNINRAFGGKKEVKEEIIATHPPYTHSCVMYGVRMVWPLILTQISLLRQAMAFMPTTKLQQASVYELEYIVEKGLQEAMGIEADEALSKLDCIHGSYKHIAETYNSRCVYFLKLPPESRLMLLPRIIESFDPMYEYLPQAKGSAFLKAGYLPQSVFALMPKEWPEVEW